MVDLSRLTQALLDEALKAGADCADAIAVDGASVSLSMRQSALEQVERSEAIEIGLRVICKGRQAVTSASDISDETIRQLAVRGVAMAKEAPVDPYVGLADPSEIVASWDVAALEIEDHAPPPSADLLEQAILQAEAAALQVKGITQVETSGAYSKSHVHLAATNGFSGGYGRSFYSISALAFTGEGLKMDRDWAAESRIFWNDMPDSAKIGQLAAERSLARIGAVQPKSGRFPVLFDERVSSTLIGHLLGAINGAVIARGASWLLDAKGQAVLPRGISLIDDALRPRSSASRPFDAEGLASQKRHIVDDGSLQGWTLDLATGRQLNMPSTANASRGISGAPTPATTNIELTQSNYSRDDLLGKMGTGLWVTSLLGSTINRTTGDYSRGASGFWVENGCVQYPVNECTIAGNLRDMLMSIIPANDARQTLSVRVPSLLIDSMSIAGR